MDKSDAGASGICMTCGHTPLYCRCGTAVKQELIPCVPPGGPTFTPTPGLYPEGVPIPASEPTPEPTPVVAPMLHDRMARLDELEDMVNEVRRLLLDLAETRVEGVDLFNHAVAQHGSDVHDWYDEEDEEAPFFSEAYLYPLLGKDAARTVLALIRSIQQTLKMRMEDLV